MKPPRARTRPRGSEPDLGPLFVFGSLMILGAGVYGGLSFWEYLRAKRRKLQEPPPSVEPSDPTGPVAVVP